MSDRQRTQRAISLQSTLAQGTLWQQLLCACLTKSTALASLTPVRLQQNNVGGLAAGGYRRQVGFSCSHMQRCSLVIVPDVHVHSSLDVAPHEGHVTLKDALTQLIRHLLVRLVHTAAGGRQVTMSMEHFTLKEVS